MRLVACASAAVLSGNGGYGRLDEKDAGKRISGRSVVNASEVEPEPSWVGWLSAGGSHRRPAPVTISPRCPLPRPAAPITVSFRDLINRFCLDAKFSRTASQANIYRNMIS
jgi:hypothetical protein